MYGADAFGRDVVRGYGSVLVPTAPGRYIRYVRLFAPRSSSMLQQLLAWLSGGQPEVPFLFIMMLQGTTIK